MRFLPLLVVVLIASARPANAADAELVWLDDGSLRATVTFDAPLDAVQRLMADPVRAIGLSPDVKGVEAAPKGDCHVVTVRTTGISDPFVYTALRCPTAAGTRSELMESADYAEQRSEWVFEAVDGGTRGVLVTRTKLTSRIPERLVRRGLKKGIAKTIKAMERALTSP